MVSIIYTPELLADYSALVDDFLMFWSMNNIHLAQSCVGEGREVMEKMAKYNTECFEKLKHTFRQPLRSHTEHNKKVLERHGGKVIRFLHDYLKHAEPRYDKYRRDIYEKRFKDVMEHYKRFHKKYF